LVFYVQACFDLRGEDFAAEARNILEAFDDELQTKCVGSISERFEGDPPYNPRGSVSHATSVGGLLYINSLIEKYSPKKPQRKCAKKAAPKAEVAEEKPKRKCVRKSVKK
jgi:glycogen debranching enzyme